MKVRVGYDDWTYLAVLGPPGDGGTRNVVDISNELLDEITTIETRFQQIHEKLHKLCNEQGVVIL